MRPVLLNKSTLAGGIIVAALILTAFLGPHLAPNDPFQIHLDARFSGPSYAYPFGTDHLGRCVLSRVLKGCGTSLGSCMAISLVITLTGVGIGLLAGMGNGKVDFLIMRLVDILLAFPSLILTLAIIGMLGPSLMSACVGICFSWWPVYARLVRTMVITAKEKEFVTTARLCGTTGFFITIRHILPQILPPILIMASLETGSLILVFSGLGFLGLGTQPPNPEWGAMLNEARTYVFTFPHLLVAPGVSIFTAIFGFSLLGEGLRETLQVKEATQW